MSLINCPECKKEISDKVKACPFCGYPFEFSSNIKQNMQQVETSSDNKKPKYPEKTKEIHNGIIAVIILAIVITAIFFFTERNKYNSYIDNINLIMITMLDGGSDAESMCNLTAQVWHNSIYEERDSTTDKFTMFSSSGFYDDFNIALNNLYSDTTTLKKISDINSNQDLVESMMKNIQKPPTGLEKCYDTITDLYTIYFSLTDLAINPTGSLQSYGESKLEKIDSFLSTYNKLKTQIPNKK